jgi:hypothetical protein
MAVILFLCSTVTSLEMLDVDSKTKKSPASNSNAISFLDVTTQKAPKKVSEKSATSESKVVNGGAVEFVDLGATAKKPSNDAKTKEDGFIDLKKSPQSASQAAEESKSPVAKKNEEEFIDLGIPTKASKPATTTTSTKKNGEKVDYVDLNGSEKKADVKKNDGKVEFVDIGGTDSTSATAGSTSKLPKSHVIMSEKIDLKKVIGSLKPPFAIPAKQAQVGEFLDLSPNSNTKKQQPAVGKDEIDSPQKTSSKLTGKSGATTASPKIEFIDIDNGKTPTSSSSSATPKAEKGSTGIQFLDIFTGGNKQDGTKSSSSSIFSPITGLWKTASKDEQKATNRIRRRRTEAAVEFLDMTDQTKAATKATDATAAQSKTTTAATATTTGTTPASKDESAAVQFLDTTVTSTTPKTSTMAAKAKKIDSETSEKKTKSPAADANTTSKKKVEADSTAVQFLDTSASTTPTKNSEKKSVPPPSSSDTPAVEFLDTATTTKTKPKPAAEEGAVSSSTVKKQQPSGDTSTAVQFLDTSTTTSATTPKSENVEKKTKSATVEDSSSVKSSKPATSDSSAVQFLDTSATNPSSKDAEKKSATSASTALDTSKAVTDEQPKASSGPKIVLITGIITAIGSEVARQLLQESVDNNVNIKVYGITPYSHLNDVKKISDKIQIIFGDPMNAVFMSTTVLDIKPCVIYHFVEENEYISSRIPNPQYIFHTNFDSTLNIFETLKRAELWKTKVFYSGSGLEYSDSSCTPMKEDMKVNIDPNSIYGLSKVSGEMLALSYYKNYAMPVRIFLFLAF